MTQYALFPNKAAGMPGHVGVSRTAVYTYGSRFTPLSDGYISQLWYFTPYASGLRTPTVISLWDGSNGQRIWYKAPADTGASAGWHATNIPSPIWVQANRLYVVSGYFPGTSGAPYQSVYAPIGNLPTPGAGLAWNSSPYADTAADMYPITTFNQYVAPFDVTFDTEYAPNPTAIATSGDVDASLSAWLHATANDYPTVSTPYLNFGLLTGLTADEAARYTVVEGRMGTAAAAAGGATLFGKIKELLPLLSGVADLTTIANNIATLLNTPTSSDDIGTVVDNLRASQLRNDGRANIAVGGSGWTLQDEYSGYESHFYDQFADAYVLNWTNLDFPAERMNVDGVELVWVRDHWACECRDGVVGKHFPLNGRTNDIRIPGVRMPGLLIHNPGGYPFNVQAWIYTG